MNKKEMKIKKQSTVKRISTSSKNKLIKELQDLKAKKEKLETQRKLFTDALALLIKKANSMSEKDMKRVMTAISKCEFMKG